MKHSRWAGGHSHHHSALPASYSPLYSHLGVSLVITSHQSDKYPASDTFLRHLISPGGSYLPHTSLIPGQFSQVWIWYKDLDLFRPDYSFSVIGPDKSVRRGREVSHRLQSRWWDWFWQTLGMWSQWTELNTIRPQHCLPPHTLTLSGLIKSNLHRWLSYTEAISFRW